MPKLKKRPDQKKLLAAARSAVEPDVKAGQPIASATAARKRGRQPGATFPNGYKKTPAATAAPAAGPEGDGKEAPRAAETAGKAPDAAVFERVGEDAGGQRAGDAQDPAGHRARVKFGGFQIDVKDSVEMLVSVVFNDVLASSRGEHWRLTQEKTKALAAPITDILEEVLPGLATNPWTYRIGAIVAVVGPPLCFDVMTHPETYAWLNFFKNNHAPKSESPDPDKKQPDPGPGTQGTGENLALTAHPQAA